MNAFTVVALLHCCLLAALVQSAPVSSPSNPKEAVERVMRLVEKIRKDVRSVHGSIINIDGFTLDSSSQTGELEMKRINLGIPDPPVLKELSEQFTADMCVSRMLAGGRLYQGLLVDLSRRLGGLEALSAELRDLVTHINQMKDAAQLSSDSSDQSSLDLALNLHGNYDVQVAAHLTLCQLLEFCHDLIRSLRNMAETQMARGTR
ncbi:uncharacterized protein LOC102780934 [Neolamprologus brichardi]|uniref:uncharacterized protein LOC102780934 n=1 Tax=Neolamprologus brichardi TaxID=32507 RepID=UPI0003EC3DF6|nr:uncharacterized protein LOC102780934 [Neolamprologus brichardi]